jgi:type IV pilus assembly protein PilA
LEILLVVGIIAILAGIVILAINPTRQLGDTRNAQRRSDVLTIINAIYQYSIDHSGDLADLNLGSAVADDVLCADDASSEDASVLAELIASSTYLTAIPFDPTTGDASDTDYDVVLRDSGRITVCAPSSLGEGNIAEDDTDEQIEVTR